jgi:uncharacterized protein (TIGR02145 family)
MTDQMMKMLINTLFLALLSFGAVSQDITTGLIAQYLFNGNADDESGNGNDGTENGGVIFTTDRFGSANSAASFDAVDDYIRIPYNTGLAFGDYLSVSAWIKTGDVTGGIVSQHNGGLDGNFVFAVNNGFGTGKFLFSPSQSVQTSAFNGQIVNDNTWHHLVGVYDHIAQNVYQYVDGQLISTIATTEILNGLEIDIIIGNENNLLWAFDGLIDDIRIYNRALIGSEISMLFAEGAFLTTWQTTTASELITIPTTGTGYNYTVDWGDGTVETGFTGEASHTYAAAGTYTISIIGDFPRIYFNGGIEGQDKDKILTIEQWGDIEWSSMYRAFRDCDLLQLKATDAPDLLNVTDLYGMFEATDIFNGDISTWDVSNVTRLTRMFAHAISFNRDLNNWDVSNVTDFAHTFIGTDQFNGDITSWDMSSATTLYGMFENAAVFNRDIGNWNMSNVTNMSRMFRNSDGFNQDIGDWNVSKVTNMSDFIKENGVFNQDLSAWDVSSVTNMAAMFDKCYAFNQNLGSWDISSITGDGMDWMFNYLSGMSQYNYDQTLAGWARLDPGETQIPQNITFSAQNVFFCEAADARLKLIDEYSWTISGDDFACSDLVAYYPFAGNALDSTNNNNDGTVNGAVLTTDRFGNDSSAYFFDGVDDEIDISNDLDFDTLPGQSLSIWFKPNKLDTMHLFGYQKTDVSPFAQYQLEIENDSIWYLVRYSGTSFDRIYIDNALENPNKWYHLVAMKDSTGLLSIYVNNVKIGQLQGTAGFNTPDASFTTKIGVYEAVSLSQYFEGSVDDIRIYSRALSVDEIQDLYYEGGYSPPTAITVSDGDGNNYNGIVIGTQVWLDENLKTTKYNDGSSIPNVTDNTAWTNLTTPGLAWYNNDSTTNAGTYGALYNWYAVDTVNLCPSGWHVPNTTDWANLASFLDGEAGLACDLKAPGLPCATEETEFNGLRSGYRDDVGAFTGLGSWEYWWTSTENSSTHGNRRAFSTNNGWLYDSPDPKEYGNSIRCIRDQITQTATTIKNFNLSGQVGTAVIDSTNFIVTLSGLSTTSFAPGITLSDGATISPPSGDTIDFTNTFIYTVTAEDRTTAQTWTVHGALDSGLVAYYPFSGNANDESGNGNNGTVSGAIDSTDRFGHNSSSYFFDGNDTIWVTGYKGISGTGSRSISGWIKTTGINEPIVVWGNAVNGQANNLSAQGGKLIFTIGGGNVTGSTIINDNKWQHVAMSWEDDGTPDVIDAKLYVDGKLESPSNTTSQTLNTGSTNDVRIGLDLSSNYFNSSIDDIRIFSTALDSTDIAALYTENNWGTPILHSAQPNAAVPGNQIRLYGKHFDEPNTKISFGVIEVTPDSTLHNVAYVTVPNIAYGYVDISVSNDYGESNPIAFTVIHQNKGGQYFGNGKIVTDLTIEPYTVHAADLDNDGDMDMLSVFFNQDKVAWYENTDGLGNFGPEKIIATQVMLVRDVFAADLDGDGDLDVLSADFGDNRVSWYENTDGGGQFGPRQLVGTTVISMIDAVDLDGDGDVDVIAAGATSDQVVWFENLDNNGSFSNKKVIGTPDDPFQVHATDIDDDGDFDVFSANTGGNNITWYENLGQGTFGSEIVISSLTSSARDVSSADLDGDGDLDILSASRNDNKVAWYENLDGKGTVSTQNIVSTSGSGAYNIHPVDIDGDGDVDILAASYYDGENSLYENTNASGSFGSQNIIALSTDIQSIYSADFNGDGLMDVVSDSDTEVAWYENQSFDESGLVAYYPFNGNANDESGNGNDGTENGGVALTIDRLGSSDAAYDFDGGDDFIELPFSYNDVSLPMTVNAWIQSGQGGNDTVYQAVFSNFNSTDFGLLLSIQGNASGFDQRVDFILYDGFTPQQATFYSGNTLPATEWTMYTWQIEDSSVSFYQNGQFISTSSYSGIILDNADNSFLIGSYDQSSFFNGRLDDIRVYDRILDATEVAQLYAQEMRPFITTWQTTAANESITIPTTGSGYNYFVDWGDGTTSSNVTVDATHTYVSAGTYSVKISGNFPRIYFNNGNEGQHKDKILNIEQWGDIAWSSMEGAFHGCSALTVPATDAPDLSGATSLNSMFSGASSFNQSIDHWDVSTIINFNSIFRDCLIFNQPLNTWNMSSGNSAESIFYNAQSFNQPLDNWNTSNFQWVAYMFWEAWSFNQPLDTWNTSSFNNMDGIIGGARAFDQDLGSWDISNVTNLNYIGNTSISTANYDATLTGWATLDAGETQIPSNITLEANGLTYCNSNTARNELLDAYGWTISGDTKCPELTYSMTSDISLAVYDTTSFNTGLGSVSGLRFSPNGRRMFVSRAGGYIHEFKLTQAFDVGTAVGNGSFSVVSQSSNTQDMTFNNDGTKLYVVDDANATVQQYSLGSPHILNTTSYNAVSFSVSGQTTGPKGIQFNPDGSKMFVLDYNDIHSYNLGTDYDASTAVHAQSFSLAPTVGVAEGFSFSSSGNRVYVINSLDDRIYQFDLGTPFDVSTATYNNVSFDFGFPFCCELDVTFDASGTWMFVLSEGIIYQYSLPSNAFQELNTNDGTVNGGIHIGIRGDTFFSTLSEGTHFTVDNLPSGFNPTMAVSSSGLIATLTLAGSEGSNLDSDDLSDLQFSFADAAFTSVNAIDTRYAIGAGSNLGINFFTGFETEITSFSFTEQTGDAYIDSDADSIAIEVSYGTNQANLIATFDVSFGATLKVGDSVQVSGTSGNDFSSLFSYYVLAENGTDSAEWVVHVTSAGSDSTDINSFSFPEQYDAVTPNTTDKTVDIQVDYGTPLTNLIALFDLSEGAELKLGDSVQVSAITANDFSSAVSYYVVAENGVDSSEWVVTVTVAPSSTTNIDTYILPNQVGSSDINTSELLVSMTVPYLTDLTNLIATFTLRENATAAVGGIGQVSGTTPNDFTDTVRYLLTAEDGISQEEWKVIVTTEKNDSSYIISLSHPELVDGSLVIDDQAFTVTAQVANGTDLTTLDPTLDISTGSTLSPLSGTARDFSLGAVTYKVTAADTSTQDWAVTITETPPENVAPTALQLTNASIAENEPTGTLIGRLSTSDPNGGDTHIYSIQSGDGSFSLVGDSLLTGIAVNFETTSSVDMTIRSTDAGTLFKDSLFTISIVDANDDPTNITLSNASLLENQPIGTFIGRFTADDEDGADMHTYSLISGTGDDDNASFEIVGDSLVSKEIFDFETKSSYSVLVQTDDGNDGTYSEAFIITVTDVNEGANTSPTAIQLSNANITENEPTGTLVGRFTTSDADAGDTHAYSVESGGSSFSVTGDSLLSEIPFNFETTSSVEVTIRSTDAGTLFKDSTFTITIGDANDTPTEITLSSASLNENEPIGTLIGRLTSADEDGADAHLYALIPGTGDDDNVSFEIVNDSVITKESFDFETKSNYMILVQTDDQNGGTLSEQFDITITDVIEGGNQPPTAILLSNTVITGGNAGQVIGTLSIEDEDDVFGDYNWSVTQGDADFEINGSQLAVRTGVTAGDYSIEIQAFKSDLLQLTQSFTVEVKSAEQVQADFDDIVNTKGKGVENYRVIGIPAQAVSVSNVFPDNGTIETKWRLVHRSGSDLGMSSSLSAGTGYWFITDTTINFSIPPTALPATLNAENQFEMSLVSGWNLIANPLRRTINWSEIVQDNIDAANISQGDVDTRFEKWKISGGTTGYLNESVVEIFEGGWVFANSAASITIDQKTYSASGRVGQEDPSLLGGIVRSNNDWQIFLKLEDQVFFNDAAGIGMHPEGLVGRDRLDQDGPPSISNEIKQSLVDQQSASALSIVAPKKGFTWTFDVALTAESSVLTWNQPLVNELNESLTLAIVPEMYTVDMASASSVTLGNAVQQVIITYGTGDDQSVLLSSFEVFPIPASEEVTVRYFETETVRVEMISIYSIDGRLVKSIELSDRKVGWSEKSVELSDLTEGIYLIELSQSNGQSVQKRVIKQ